MPVTPITPAQIDEVGKGACLTAPGSSPSGDAPDGSSSQATAIPSRERPWQPWERNYSGNRIGVRTDGEWTILHVLSGGAETTTSIREHEAWDLAMRVSPKLAALLKEIGDENRKMRDALFKLGPQCRQENIEELQEAAEEVDCGDGCSNHFYDGSCNAHECHRENTDGGCSWLRAESLRELATALQTQVEIEGSVRDCSGEAAETLGSADRQKPGHEVATPSIPSSPRKGQEENPCPMTVEEAREVLDGLSDMLPPEGHMKSMRSAASRIASSAPRRSRSLDAKADRIELALSTIRASEEDR